MLTNDQVKEYEQRFAVLVGRYLAFKEKIEQQEFVTVDVMKLAKTMSYFQGAMTVYVVLQEICGTNIENGMNHFLINASKDLDGLYAEISKDLDLISKPVSR